MRNCPVRLHFDPDLMFPPPLTDLLQHRCERHGIGHPLRNLWYASPQFTGSLQEANHFALTGEQLLERYAVKLKGDGVSDGEIARKIRLIRGDRPEAGQGTGAEAAYRYRSRR